ncbi:MAG: sugar phosphate isomerase/epimerase [Lentimicrobium sp.]|jgi:sugar phosphate isomerase/epimerase|nr:sugar phosphate isomerase/epimerase [Lentimicrobium sp.]
MMNFKTPFTKMILMAIMACFAIHIPSEAKARKNSGKQGVQIGAITYSYRSMPDQSIEAILDYLVRSGINSAELMGGPVEQYAGIPQVKDQAAIKAWRTTVEMDKFKEIKKMFDKKKVKIDILKLGESRWSDEEIDYAFNVCKTLGARGISMEISEQTAKRMAPFAEKHNLYVILHNHLQPGDPGFSFDKILAYGKKLMLNFDCGHYYGATGLHPNPLIERLHDRIASIHIKDKTGPKAVEPNQNKPFGMGETPVKEILQLVQKNNWPITCDIELEYNIPKESDAVKEVTKCVEYCQKALMP